MSWLKKEKKTGFWEQRAPGGTSERPHQSGRVAAVEPGRYTDLISHQSLAGRPIFSLDRAPTVIGQMADWGGRPGAILNCKFSRYHSNQTDLLGSPFFFFFFKSQVSLDQFVFNSGEREPSLAAFSTDPNTVQNSVLIFIKLIKQNDIVTKWRRKKREIYVWCMYLSFCC